MSEATQKAYVAGIIDGEGTITLTRLYKNARWKTPIVSVSSTTQERNLRSFTEPLFWFKSMSK
ncbi:MAG: hypothetical protein CL920_12905 [Deltaproteobacteria bacterium]|nr:hypothetical protein [Deltaproteobacteria bacterium]